MTPAGWQFLLIFFFVLLVPKFTAQYKTYNQFLNIVLFTLAQTFIIIQITVQP